MYKLLFLLLLLTGLGYYVYQQGLVAKFQEYITLKHMITLTSSAFTNNSPIPPLYTCDGEGKNPPLSIRNVPEVAQSLVLLVDDPDAPSGTYTHWVLFNMSSQTVDIAEKSVPDSAVVGQASSGTIGYEAPCPPSGTHRYVFTLFALDSTLPLERGASRPEVEKAMQGHIVDKTELVGLYSR